MGARDVARAIDALRRGWPVKLDDISFLAIETADEAAVMNARDREQFLRVVQDFAAQHSLDFHISRKAPVPGSRRNCLKGCAP